MDTDLESRVMETRRVLESLREDKVRKEERLANLTQQKADIEKQLKSLGLDPSKLEDIISEKTSELESKVAKFEQDTGHLAKSLAAIQEKLAEA